MKRNMLIAGALLLGFAREAQAQFAAGENVVTIKSGDALGALFWAQNVNCKSAPDDLARRQCEGVKEARAGYRAGKTYVVSGDSAALEVGAFDGKTKSVPVVVRGCLACESAVDVGGDARRVVTDGKLGSQGGALQGPEVARTQKTFSDEAAAQKWIETVAPRLKVDFAFQVPARANDWSQGAFKGYAVNLVGFRVYDACDGTVLASRPDNAQAPANPKACGKTVAEAETPKDEVEENREAEKQEPKLPRRLSARQINAAMRPAKAKVEQCYQTYGVPGTAKVLFDVQPDGTLKNVRLAGEFKDTPTGTCVLEAVKSTQFPKFSGREMPLSYPFLLR